MLPVAVFTVYILAGNRKNLYFGIFIISVFMSAFNITEFNTLVEKYLPDVILERSEKYRDEDQAQEFREGDQ